MKNNFPFHIVTPSPWPLVLSINLMNLFWGLLNYLNGKTLLIFLLFMYMILFLTLFQWWRDVVRESTFQGMHSCKVVKLLKISMIMFIISELMFFISLFWCFFHSSISFEMNIGMWPPKMIIMFNPYDIPLLNSIILISSSFYVTWSHYELLNGNMKMSLMTLSISVFLGLVFSGIQVYEYYQSTFCINDGIFGSIFFMITGFHGLHVNIGIIFLISCFIRMYMGHFSKIHHLHFEIAAWYWHFVDVVWLFVYIFIYWWMY